MLCNLFPNNIFQEAIVNEIETILEDGKILPDFEKLGEMKLMERVIKESLRLYPSVPTIMRIASGDIKTFTGYTIPKGTNIYIPIFQLHRSPNIWENPDMFDPDRFLPENSSKRHPYSFIPFSAGPRNCIGKLISYLFLLMLTFLFLRTKMIMKKPGKSLKILFLL